jgi:hypothetical protein
MTISENRFVDTFRSAPIQNLLVKHNDHRLGVFLILASAVAFSTAGFFTRLIELDVWTVLFWRGIYGGLFIAAYVACQHGSETLNSVRSIGLPGFLSVCCTALSTICFVAALRHTTVADVNVIYATAPFFAAGLQWLEPDDPCGERGCPACRRTNRRRCGGRGTPYRRSPRFRDDGLACDHDGRHSQ